MLEDDCDVVEECPAKIARKGDCYPSRDHTYSRPPKELSSPVIHSYIGHSWVSLCLLLHYLRMKHTDYKDIHFTCMGCNECVISRHTKNHGVVVDFTSSTLDKVTRANLKDVATAYGFGSCSFTRIPCMKEERSLFIEFQAIEICFLLKNGVPSFPSEIEMATNSQLLNVANDMENLLGINISLPTASQQVNLRENCLRRGHLQRNVPRTKKTANKRNTNLGKIGNFSKLLLIGEMDKVCRHCAALSFQGERKSICCNGGENIVPESVFNPNRDPLLDWFWEIALTNESIFYMIRPINNLLACAGININLKSFQGVPGQRPLVLQGRFDIGLCHLSPDSERACFAQLFIADDFKLQSSIQQTMKSWSTEVEYSIIKRLMDILRKNNAIVHSYLTMFEIYKKQLEKNGNAPECRVIMNLKNKREITSTVAPGVHPGRLNIPVFENQIAAIYLSEDGNMLSHEELDKGLLIMSRGGKTIAAHHSYNIDALTYPLYFPRGEQSFVKEKLPKKRTIMAKNTESQTGSQLTVSQPAESKNVDLDDLCGNEDCENATNKAAPKEKFMSRREFVLFILARRGDVKKHRILGTGKLYSQYVLHSFARIEADRLCAIGLHSTELRSSTASALFRYLDDKLREKGVKLGKLINMPQRYVGSRKWYEKLYGDAMAVAQRIGKPDLFITFTGSQDWPEIKNNLPGKLDSWITDPFLCCRVFFLRLSHFIDDIKNKEVFGKVKALHGSIEFQKRGMPHAHLLVTLHEKIDTPDKVDSYISAELPEYPSANDSQREENSNVLEDVKSLKHIEKIITGNGMTLKDCGLDETLESLIDASNDINISMSHANDDPIEDNLELNYSQIISQLNDKQKVVVESVLRVSNMPKNSGDRVFFVYGKAGCGKTYTFNTLIRVLELNNKSVITVASTGIAATLLKNGRTAHSAFGLPLKRLCSDSVANVDASSAAGLMLRNVDVIIWDEISMQTRFAVECVDRLLRDVAAPENSALPFGGVIMVFGGDWCQFLPVVPGGSRLEIINETLKSSSLWRSMTILILDQNMRLIPGEEKHAAWLRAVGEGANYMSDGMHIDIPSCMCLPSEKDVINWIYTQDTLRSPELLGRVALLTVRNCDAIELNETVLRMIPGDITELYGIDTPASEEDGAIGMPCDDEEYLHQLTPSGMPQYKISVKKGAIVMLLRNIDVSERLCNGTRLEVLSVICDS
ncbi:hypothetical protein ANCCEY_15144, partial [Ancylostoma ceylanicum]